MLNSPLLVKWRVQCVKASPEVGEEGGVDFAVVHRIERGDGSAVEEPGEDFADRFAGDEFVGGVVGGEERGVIQPSTTWLVWVTSLS